MELDSLVKLGEQIAPRELDRFDRSRAARLRANGRPRYARGDATAYRERAGSPVLAPDVPAALETFLGRRSRAAVRREAAA